MTMRKPSVKKSSIKQQYVRARVIYSNKINGSLLASALERAKNIFYDASDEFCQLDFIVDRFVGWLIADEKSFEDAFVFLCIPKLISPFIRLEMLDWNPLMVINFD